MSKTKIAALVALDSPLAAAMIEELSSNHEIVEKVVGLRRHKNSFLKRLERAPFSSLWQALFAQMVFSSKASTLNSQTHVLTPVYSSEDLSRVSKRWLAQGVREVWVCGFRYKLDTALLGSGLRFINIHASHLPDYRGADPIFWQMVDRQRRFGLSIHLIDEGIDTGPLLAQQYVAPPFPGLRYSVEMALARSLAPLIRRAKNTAPRAQPAGGWRDPYPSRKAVRERTRAHRYQRR